MGVSFSDLVTPAGAVISAGIIVMLVELLKKSFPMLDERFAGSTMAFFISAILYTATLLALMSTGVVSSPDGALGVFLAWLSAATSAVGIKNTYTRLAAARK